MSRPAASGPSIPSGAPGQGMQPEGLRAIDRALPEEVPVALVFDASTLAVMMASPGDIHDMAVGFALSEGIITAPEEITGFEEAAHPQGIEARLWLREDRAAALRDRRRFMAGPVGCGLCGIDSLEQAVRPVPAVTAPDLRLGRAEVAGAGAALAARQPLRARTGATHAAGFLRPGAGIVAVREDVGRHNALDKLFGALARDGQDAGQGAVVMTSRLSVELVQKCAMLGCPVLISVSAPTAAAQRLAEDRGITLIGFARGGDFDIFAHPGRIETGGIDAG